MEGKTNSSFAAPTLCAKCCSFYANPQFGTYCSKCYKELNLSTLPQPNTIISQPATISPDTNSPTLSPNKQTDHSMCWSCNKKAGMSAYKCKCEYTYCKKHRLPESHACDFDFVNEGRQALAKANPNCMTDKIERL